jgi:hypothetical protein
VIIVKPGSRHGLKGLAGHAGVGAVTLRAERVSKDCC